MTLPSPASPLSPASSGRTAPAFAALAAPGAFAALALAGASPVSASDAISVERSETEIRILAGERPVLTYHVAEVPPPPEAHPIFRRSGFIHPLHAPGGGKVTGIHPDDHYHHLGLWHAWTRTVHDERETDFWNLRGGTGRVRHVEVLETTPAGFVAALEQVSYPEGIDAPELVVLSERLRVEAALADGAYEIDYDYEQTNVTEHALELPAYRYGGGIAYRGPLDWDAENSDYLTSEGLRRQGSHATRARWVAMHGPADGGDGDATVAILCHPENHDAPQRIRTWDNGKMFFNYTPIQEHDWRIAPGETARMRYRIVVFDGVADADAVEARWNAYAEASE